MSAKTASWLDTSAVIAFLRAEPGFEIVRGLLTDAQRGRAKLLLAQISLTELAHYLAKAHDAESVTADIRLFLEMPVGIVLPSTEQAIRAGLLRNRQKVSTADAIIATLAMEAGAELVHKDPEFDAIPGLNHRRLPYKSRAR